MNSKEAAVWVQGREGVKLLSAALKKPRSFQSSYWPQSQWFLWTSKQAFSASK